MNTKKEYITPELTVVSFKVEMGFTQSNTVNMPGSGVTDPLNMSIFDGNAQETWGWTTDPNTGNTLDNHFGGSSFSDWD